jgi:molybdopterin synthase sulfur carrier subunit
MDMHYIGGANVGMPAMPGPTDATEPDQEQVVKVRYFAWVRERIGRPEEEIDPPPAIATVAELMHWLSRRGEEYAYAFENPKVIRAAIDRAHVKPDAAISGAREIAFFPPMTGG